MHLLTVRSGRGIPLGICPVDTITVVTVDEGILYLVEKSFISTACLIKSAPGSKILRILQKLFMYNLKVLDNIRGKQTVLQVNGSFKTIRYPLFGRGNVTGSNITLHAGSMQLGQTLLHILSIFVHGQVSNSKLENIDRAKHIIPEELLELLKSIGTRAKLVFNLEDVGHTAGNITPRIEVKFSNLQEALILEFLNELGEFLIHRLTDNLRQGINEVI